MPIPIECPQCKAGARAPDGAAGKAVKCPACGSKFTVPNIEVVADPPRRVAPSIPPMPIPMNNAKPVVHQSSPWLAVAICGGVFGVLALILVVAVVAQFFLFKTTEVVADAKPKPAPPPIVIPEAPPEPKLEKKPVEPILDPIKLPEVPPEKLDDLLFWNKTQTPKWVNLSKYKDAKIFPKSLEYLTMHLDRGTVAKYSRQAFDFDTGRTQAISGAIWVDRAHWRSLNVLERREFATLITSFFERVIHDSSLPTNAKPSVRILDSKTSELLGRREKGQLGTILP